MFLLDFVVSSLPVCLEKGLFRQEFITVITTNGVFGFLVVFTSMYDSERGQQASTALSNKLQNNEVRSWLEIKSVVPLRIST